MKRLFCLTLALALALTLTACGCKHETWQEADCVNPKTCADCGETEGAPLGHSWLVATCANPKTCEVCGETIGEALGHTWTEATCTTPKTCSVCDETEGETLGHTWTDATCTTPKTCGVCGVTEGDVTDHTWVDATTEAPKTCTGCGLTEGERIIVDERFTTEATKDYHGTWACRLDLDGELMGLDGLEGTLPVNLLIVLTNDGHLQMSLEVADQEEYYQTLKAYMIDLLYRELADAGMDKEAADQAMQDVYNMTIEEYAETNLEQLDMDNLFSEFSYNLVYYIADGDLYSAASWEESMSCTEIKLDGDSLTIENMGAEMGYNDGDLIFTRVTE